MVVSRTAEMKIIDANTGIVLSTLNIPYGSDFFLKEKEQSKKEMLFANGIHIMV